MLKILLDNVVVMIMIMMIPEQLVVVGNALVPIVLLPAPDQFMHVNDEQPKNADSSNDDNDGDDDDDR